MHFLPLNPTYSTECAKACNNRNQPESLAIRKHGLPGEHNYLPGYTEWLKPSLFFSFFMQMRSGRSEQEWSVVCVKQMCGPQLYCSF